MAVGNAVADSCVAVAAVVTTVALIDAAVVVSTMRMLMMLILLNIKSKQIFMVSLPAAIEQIQ